jgi:hypothetical protein
MYKRTFSAELAPRISIMAVIDGNVRKKRDGISRRLRPILLIQYLYWVIIILGSLLLKELPALPPHISRHSALFLRAHCSIERGSTVDE